jgi:serine/threonine protein kinase
MSRLRSPNVVGYVESGLSKGNDVYWLVMELLEADSLDHILDKDGPIPELDVIRVCPLLSRNMNKTILEFKASASNTLTT